MDRTASSVARHALRCTRMHYLLPALSSSMNLSYRAGTDRDNFTVIALFSSNPSGRYGLSCVNVHDGKMHHPGPETESLAPSGDTCKPETGGLLRRVSGCGDRRDAGGSIESGEDGSLTCQLVSVRFFCPASYQETGGESGIRTRSQTANKGLNRARSANLVLVSACKTRELILSDLQPAYQMRH
jgi:hypothetical protein